jgi:protein-S-isoprenylcysteine O-methyltransferase Ste14
MSSTEALNAGDVTRIGVIVIVVLVVVGALLSIVITALVGRLIILVVVVALGIFVWQQRSSVENSFTSKACNLHTTFFGIHLNPPDSVAQACRGRS